MHNRKLYLTLSAPGARSILEGALRTGVLPAEPPKYVEVDQQRHKTSDPLEHADVAHDLEVSWGLTASFSLSRKRDQAVVSRWRMTLDAGDFASTIADWNFETGLTQSPDPEWWPEDYTSIHGWMFAVKGRGHRLVSSRIIERGPWRLLRDEARDVTLFQFCDLEAEGSVALEQAKPGHALLAPVWQGGHYASQRWAFVSAMDGYKPSLYEAASRTSVVLVQEREVSAAEMSIAAATRVHQVFDEQVDQVRFVYFDEAMARKQLPELWLRGLEVHVITPTGERRIDTEYEPPPIPPPPDWVKRLEGT